jgi:hypothetical protein
MRQYKISQKEWDEAIETAKKETYKNPGPVEVKHSKKTKPKWARWIDIRKPEGFFSAIIIGIIIGLLINLFML